MTLCSKITSITVDGIKPCMTCLIDLTVLPHDITINRCERYTDSTEHCHIHQEKYVKQINKINMFGVICDDIIFLIFGYIEAIDLFNMLRVSWKMRNLCQTPDRLRMYNNCTFCRYDAPCRWAYDTPNTLKNFKKMINNDIAMLLSAQDKLCINFADCVLQWEYIFIIYAYMTNFLVHLHKINEYNKLIQVSLARINVLMDQANKKYYVHHVLEYFRHKFIEAENLQKRSR